MTGQSALTLGAGIYLVNRMLRAGEGVCVCASVCSPGPDRALQPYRREAVCRPAGRVRAGEGGGAGTVTHRAALAALVRDLLPFDGIEM